MRYILSFAIFLILTLFAHGQRTITGSVLDAQSGEGLIGVNIMVKETSQGSTTDFEGNFVIDISAEAKTLVFSYVGYITKEYLLDEQNECKILMDQGETLEEVVVIGYGSVKREDATGSLQSVHSKDFNRGSLTGPQELLSGKIAGVSINTEGGPGNGSKIRIRGESSLAASNDPLIIIDGVPLDNSGVEGSRNMLNIINPNDIEAMTVLKDASASAIYGNRASGGVILITTKKGELGSKLKFGYNGNISYGIPESKIDLLNADEYRALIEERYGVEHPAYAILGDANTDWQDEIYSGALGHDHNMSLSGAVGNFPYRISLGYANKDGILNNDKFNRTSGSLNLTPSFIDNRLQIKLHGKAIRINNHFANTQSIWMASAFDPTQAVYDPESPYGGFTTWVDTHGNPITVGAPFNPVASLEQTNDKANINRYLTNVIFDYRFAFLPELRANLNLAYDKSSSERTLIIPSTAAFTFNEITGGGIDNLYNQQKKNALLETYFNYKKKISKNRVDLMGGYSWQHFYVEQDVFKSDAAHNPSQTVENLDKAEYYLLSLFGRLNYSYNEKYFLTFTMRRDGTSRFSPERRWGLFPAAALAVKLIDNDDLYFNTLKLRAGVGVTGQQDIGDEVNNYYAYQAQYQYGLDNAQSQFGDNFVNTIRPNGYDADIHWEETTTYNVGFDFSIIKNRISGVFDVYQKNTKDLLNLIPVPAGTNLTNFIVTNVGNMKNRGFEISLNLTPYLSDNKVWDVALNLAHNKAEITKLIQNDDENYKGVFTGGISGGGIGTFIQIHSKGFEPSSFYVYEQLYDENGKLLEGEFRDRNEDGIVNADDRYHYKKPAADYTFGFSSNFKWSDLTISFAGRASIGNYVYNNIQTAQGYYNRLYASANALWNINQSAIDYDVVDQANLSFSDHFVQEASFLKIDHITCSYNLNKLLKKNVDVFFTAQNPFVFSKYAGLDPEAKDGIDNNLYPRAKTFVFGLNMNL